MNAKRNALGKGLGALLDAAQKEPAPGGAAEVPVDRIDPNPFQPRDRFEETALDELAESIRRHGIIQPVTLRQTGDGRYQLIAGERRWRAAQRAGLDRLPAYVRVANDESMLEMALVENIQRENLNPIEIALSFERMVSELNMTVETVAQRAAKDRTTVVNYLRLLKLPAIVQAALRENKLTMGHARALLGIDDPAAQMNLFQDILAGGLSVRNVEKSVRARKTRRPPQVADLPPDYRTVRDRLAGAYETRVELTVKPDGGGKIIFSYYSTDDLNRLLDLLDA
jgi:ParB family chromosome partitioning protein